MNVTSRIPSGTLAAIFPIKCFLSLMRNVKEVVRPCLIFSERATMIQR